MTRRQRCAWIWWCGCMRNIFVGGHVYVVCVVGGESRARVKTCLAVLHLALILQSTYVCHVRRVCLSACLPSHLSIPLDAHKRDLQMPCRSRWSSARPCWRSYHHWLVLLVGGEGRHAVEHGRKPRSCIAAAVQLLSQISQCLAGWQAGRRNKTSRDDLTRLFLAPECTSTYLLCIWICLDAVNGSCSAPETPRTLGP